MENQRAVDARPARNGLAKSLRRIVGGGADKFQDGLSWLKLVRAEIKDRFYDCAERIVPRRTATRLLHFLWPTWETVWIGTYPTADVLRVALRLSGNQMDVLTADVLGKISIAPEPAMIKLVVVRVRELGFSRGAMLRQICERVQSDLRLDLCLAETAAQVALQVHPKRFGKRTMRIILGSAPISSSSDSPKKLFRVVRVNGGLRLDCICGDLDGCFLYGSDCLVFVKQ